VPAGRKGGVQLPLRPIIKSYAVTVDKQLLSNLQESLWKMDWSEQLPTNVLKELESCIKDEFRAVL